MAETNELRYMDISGLPLLAKGGTSKVYAIDDRYALKAFSHFVTYETIEKENYLTRLLLAKGVPTIGCGDIVRTDAGYGIIVERTAAENLSGLITRNPEKTDEYVKGYVSVVKRIGECTATAEELMSERQHCLNRIELIRKYIKEDQYEALVRLAEAIPECDNIIHGDLHTRNVRRAEDGSMLVIDMADSKRGPVIFDVAYIYQYVFLAEKLPMFNFCKQFTKLNGKDYIKVWGKFVLEYTGITDEAELEEYEKKLTKLAIFCVILSSTDRGERFIKLMSRFYRYYISRKIIPDFAEYMEIFANLK